MAGEGRQHDERADAVNGSGRLKASKQVGEHGRPWLGRVEQRQPAQRAADEGQHEQRVHDALGAGEAPVVAPAAGHCPLARPRVQVC